MTMSVEQAIRALECYSVLPDESELFQAIGERVPNLADYFGFWSIAPEPFRSAVERFNRMDLHVHLQDSAIRQATIERNGRRPFTLTDDGVAVLKINGPMSKQVGSMQEGTSTVRLRQQLRAARKDPAVVAALLIMDTPGGTVAGNSDLAAEVARFQQAKPIAVYGEDMIASAGVSVASQAGRISMNGRSALYGAMGTYSVVYDSSRMAERLGVAVHVIRAGEFKGAGEPGTEVTDDQLSEWQRIVNVLNDNYLELIATGRQMPFSRIRELADGRIFAAGEALEMGLIDAIETYDQAYSALVNRVSSGTPVARSRFLSAVDSETDPDDEVDELVDDDEERGQAEPTRSETVSVTLQELKQNFPTSTAEWREEMIEGGRSLQEAAIDFANRKASEADELRQAAQEREAEAERRTQSTLGHAPLTRQSIAGGAPDALYETGDPVADFSAKVAEIAGPRATMQQRRQAIAAVSRQHPRLHQAYLLATNKGRKQRRQLQEKFEATVGESED